MWNVATRPAFETLKSKLSSTPILALPNFTQEFQLETDSSVQGIGAVLAQKGHPMAYYSRKLSNRMQGASTYYGQIFAIKQAVSKWRQYLLGRRFTIYTDQQSLKNLTNQTIQTPEQQKWLSKLVGFDFQIIYRPGKLNQAAMLSHELVRLFFTISVRGYDLECELKELNQTHPELLALQQSIQSSSTTSLGFQFRNSLLFFWGRLVIPVDSSLRHKLLHEFHGTIVGGHAGGSHTYHRISSNFYWNGMKKDVQTFVSAYQVCQQMKDSHHLHAGLLQPIPVPSMVFEDIAMDFIICLPSSTVKSTIMTVVDRLSKYRHFIALPSIFSAQSVTEAFVVGIIRLRGPPRSIVTDRDPRFLHTFWQELHHLQGITLAMSTAYHPQTDGQSEALNKCVEQYLCCFVADAPKQWVTMLPWAEYWYNTSYQSSAGMTPSRHCMEGIRLLLHVV